MMKANVFVSFLVVTVTLSGGLTSLARSSAGELGFDPDRLGRLDGAIGREIEEGRLAGAVMLVRRHGENAVFKSYGRQDIEADVPMPVDAIFRIASMSKAVTTVAALMLYEEGRFQLNDPVSKFIPEFADSVVALPAPEGSPPDVKFVTELAHREITIRHLMTQLRPAVGDLNQRVKYLTYQALVE